MTDRSWNGDRVPSLYLCRALTEQSMSALRHLSWWASGIPRFLITHNSSSLMHKFLLGNSGKKWRRRKRENDTEVCSSGFSEKEKYMFLNSRLVLWGSCGKQVGHVPHSYAYWWRLKPCNSWRAGQVLTSRTAHALADTAGSLTPESSVVCTGQSWQALYMLEPTNAYTLSWHAHRGKVVQKH